MRTDKERKRKKIRRGGYTFEEVENFKYCAIISVNAKQRPHKK